LRWSLCVTATPTRCSKRRPQRDWAETVTGLRRLRLPHIAVSSPTLVAAPETYWALDRWDCSDACQILYSLVLLIFLPPFRNFVVHTMPWFVCDNCGDSIKKVKPSHSRSCSGLYWLLTSSCSYSSAQACEPFPDLPWPQLHVRGLQQDV
jgi:hypothetical protein